MSINWGTEKDVVHMYSRIINNNIIKNKIMPFAATWMDLETVRLSEVRQRRDTYDNCLYVKSFKMVQMNLLTKYK